VNLRKHGVSFEEASTAFENSLRIDYDEFHSAAEDRYIAIGLSNRDRKLFVSHTYRDGNVRIIMARVVGKDEWKRYVEGNP
jgi:hypothetical protein